MDLSKIKIEDLPIQFDFLESGVLDLPSTSSSQELPNESDSDSDLEYSDNDDEENLSEYQDTSVVSILPNPKPAASSPKKAIRRTVSKLPKALQGLMGEANLRYARGETDLAEKICYEVIRQAPDAYEPYLTLTQIYENKDPKKCEAFLTLVTRLNPQNVGSWCQLAEIKLKQEQLNAALFCYSMAVRVEPRNLELHLKRIRLAEQLGEEKALLKFKVKMAFHLPRKCYEDMIRIVKEVVQIYHGEKAYDKAISALEIPFKRVPKKVTPDLINMMLELLLASDKTAQCLDIFTQFCNFEFELSVNDDGSVCIDSYTMPEDTQIDIKTKFIICAIKLKSTRVVMPLIDSLIVAYDVDKIGDLYLDIAEALIAEEWYEDALKLLVPLVKSKDYSLAGVWLKYAESLNNCNMYEQAVEAYFTVMALAPKHIEVLYPLSMLLLKLGKEKEALEVLSSQDASFGKLDVLVLLKRLNLLKQNNFVKEYFKTAELLLSRHCVMFRNPEEIRNAFCVTYWDKINKIKKMREFRCDPVEPIREIESVNEPSPEEEYVILKEMLEYARVKRQYVDMEKLALMALTSKKFLDKHAELMLISFYGCLYNRDSYHGFSIIRDILLHHPENNYVWNLVNLMLQNSDETRYSKFISRLQLRYDMHSAQMIEANNELSIGNVSTALNYYLRQFKKNESPFLSFMIGVAMLQIYFQRKHVDKKMLAQVTTFMFINYAKLRSKHANNEVYYNLGRMYHQLGVMHLAEHYYKLVLKHSSPVIDEEPNLLCLKQEAAFNLHLIYKLHGNFDEARNVLIKHIVV